MFDVEAVKQADDTNEIKRLADAIVSAVKDAQPKAQPSIKLVTAESMLIDAIQEIVFGDYCDSMSVTCVGGVLIVNAPEEICEKVESFAQDLRFNMEKGR